MSPRIKNYSVPYKRNKIRNARLKELANNNYKGYHLSGKSVGSLCSCRLQYFSTLQVDRQIAILSSFENLVTADAHQDLDMDQLPALEMKNMECRRPWKINTITKGKYFY
ncbi:hypothetical protein C0J52_05075 [Blattella germanica]|nr:hypothetical protein C0J52_05075 [Blattella germanica]